MTRDEILKEANERISLDRNVRYGAPENNFQKIAELWTAYKGIPFTAKDVALMMILLKVARTSSNDHNPDSFVDIAGYAACGGEILSES